jgi:hypothetical protein
MFKMIREHLLEERQLTDQMNWRIWIGVTGKNDEMSAAMNDRDHPGGKDEDDTGTEIEKVTHPLAGTEVEAGRHILEQRQIGMSSWRDCPWI